jgi:hypothetical protein
MSMLFMWVPVVVAFLVGVPVAPDPAHPQQWPQVKPGVWEIETTWTLRPSGELREQKLKTSACQDVIALFQGYWGTGIVNRASCRFQSTKVSDTEFKITSACPVRRVGVTKSESIVTLNSDDMFAINVRHHEGKRTSTIHQTGRWLSTCPAAPEAPP